MVQNDMDQWTEALSRCKLNEAVLPTSRGYLIENVECYNKIQALLNAPAMEHCHKFLYNLDVEDLQEDEVSKIDELYKLGQDRGFIPQDTFEPDSTEDVVAAVDMAPIEEPPVQAPQATQPEVTQPLAAFTVMYSAMKDGQIKTGEAYSNSISPRAAKADVLAKLSQCGYDNISILAIEATDPDGVATQPYQAMQTQPAVGQVGVAIADAEKQDSNDDEASDDEAASNDEDDGEPVEEAAKKEDAEEPEDDAEDDAAEEPEKKDDKKELSANEKQTLKDGYKTAFKEAMLACEFDGMKFDDLTLEQKIELFTKLDEKWSGKPDPTEFMDQDDTDKLNSTVVKG